MENIEMINGNSSGVNGEREPGYTYAAPSRSRTLADLDEKRVSNHFKEIKKMPRNRCLKTTLHSLTSARTN